MSGGDESFRPLVQYQPIWLVLAILALILIAVWFSLIFFWTKKKKPRTIADLPKLAPATVDIVSLRQKYLKMIDLVESDVKSKRISMRTAHQSLSRIVRDFAFEVSGFAAPTLTLSDLKKSGRQNLTSVIEYYYPNEFAQIGHGNLNDSLNGARKVVSEWQ